MSNKPKVSVIIPVYNVEKYIDKCLNSLINQTLEDIEFIVVNDGSKDSSKEIIKRYMEKTDKIKYYEKENGGLSDARNYGLEYANGEYVAFLDSDDYVENTMYEKMYNKAEENNLDYVECNFYWTYIDDKNNIKKLKKDIGKKYKNKNEMMIYGRVVAWNKLIKRTLIKEKFPKGLNYEDVEFFYKLIPEINTFGFVDEPLIYYVQRENSIINKQTYKTGQIFNVLDNVIDFYKKNKIYDEYEQELEYTYTRLLLCSSFKRIKKIQDDVQREKLLYETWQNLNTKFPNWKKNKILRSDKSFKNIYIRSVNKFTYKIYSKI